MATPAPHPLSGVKVLLFDVFGTVVNWRASIEHALASAAAASTNPSRAANTDWPAFANDWRQAYMVFVRSVGTGQRAPTPIEEFFRSSLVDLLAKYELQGLLSEAQIDELAGAWGRLEGWPDSSAGLKALQGLGLKTCTLSNGSKRLLGQMAQHSDLSWTHVFSSEDFGSFKPDPKVYQGGAREAGVQVGEAAMVAAHLYDLEAAKKVGLRAIYVERKQEEDASEAEQERMRKEVVDLWVGIEENGFLSVLEELKKVGIGK